MKIWGIIDIEIETNEPISKSKIDQLRRAIDKITRKEFESSVSDIVEYYEVPIQACLVSLGSLGCDIKHENED
jgi:hypothetical protein